ncbi:MAG TPA: GIY-YIG nuclease family protein [Burkholderiales bacterium]|nr:GIY-YIG nuclease family protein [Burkholderiales bacterium]
MKQRILAEIKRTAVANGGKPLGHRAFEKETGIGYYDWYGKYWKSWGDAVREAGMIANAMTLRVEDEVLLRRFAELTSTLGRIPSTGDMVLYRQTDPTFPTEKTYRRFRSKDQLVAQARDFCLAHSELAGIAEILAAHTRRKPLKEREANGAEPKTGFVYMIKHGARSEYKIGRTANPVRREGEMRLQLPDRIEPVHYIETDDPSGIEAYWHSRFASKRKEGEWFSLTPDDVRAFKKWRRIS